MNKPQTILRQARLEETAQLMEVELLSWPKGLVAKEEMLCSRLETYAEGQWVAEMDGRIGADSWAQRIRQEFLESHGHSFAELTDHGRFAGSHDREGEIYQLVGVGVRPEMRGHQLGRRLIDRQIDFARSLPGVKRIVGVTRPARYYRRRSLPIEEYVELRREDGRVWDPVLAFHLEAGARLVSVLPNFRPEDWQSCGYGVLIEYPC